MKDLHMEIGTFLIIILTIGYLVSGHRKTSFNREEKAHYMKSQKWREKRQIILKRDNHKCVKCHTKDRLEVHHKTYERLGNEYNRDLVVLCRSCHQKIHDRLGYNYSTYYW